MSKSLNNIDATCPECGSSNVRKDVFGGHIHENGVGQIIDIEIYGELILECFNCDKEWEVDCDE